MTKPQIYLQKTRCRTNC